LVEEIADYQYKIINNYLIYAAAQKAKLEKIWCIVVEPTPESIEQINLFTGNSKPRINLNVASEEAIFAALQYLSETNPLFNKVDCNKAATQIAKADRDFWIDFTEISKLKCGITNTAKAKKIDALAEVFFLAPSPKIENTPKPTKISIKQASLEEIFDRLSYLSAQRINNFHLIDADKISDKIFNAYKSKWKSLNPIEKLECGIDKNQIKTLKELFTI
jgi:hypothetical protein